MQSTRSNATVIKNLSYLNILILQAVDKLLAKISAAEDKLAVMELHYGKIVADKSVL